MWMYIQFVSVLSNEEHASCDGQKRVRKPYIVYVVYTNQRGCEILSESVRRKWFQNHWESAMRAIISDAVCFACHIHKYAWLITFERIDCMYRDVTRYQSVIFHPIRIFVRNKVSENNPATVCVCVCVPYAYTQLYIDPHTAWVSTCHSYHSVYIANVAEKKTHTLLLLLAHIKVEKRTQKK